MFDIFQPGFGNRWLNLLGNLLFVFALWHFGRKFFEGKGGGCGCSGGGGGSSAGQPMSMAQKRAAAAAMNGGDQ